MQLSILANDEWLRPFAPAIEHRHRKITGLYNSICDEYGSTSPRRTTTTASTPTPTAA